MADTDTKDSTAVAMDEEEKENKEPSGSRRSGRSKKAVERLTVYQAPKERVVIPGSGVPLGSIDNIRESVSKANIEDIKILHKILHGSDGKKTIRKRKIREFMGVPDDFVGSLRKRIEKLKTKELRYCLTILDLKRSTDKGEMVETAVSFLKKPSEDGTMMSKTSKIKKLGGKKRKSAGKKRKESGKKRTASSYMLFANSIREQVKKENPEKKITELAKIFGEKWRALSDEAKKPFKEEAEKLKKEAGGSDAPQKKKKAKPTKKAAKKPKKADPENEETDSDDDEDDEDEPLGPKIEYKLKASVDEIMNVEDLSQLSVRKIKDKLKEAYGEAVVKEHKSMIKAYVKSKVE